MIFLDTSVLVPACQTRHEHHDLSHKLLSRQTPATAACAGHSLAEMFSVLTRMPAPFRMTADEALFFVEEMKQRLSVWVIGPHDYFTTIRSCVEQKQSGGLIFDALLIACARKGGAQHIATWDVKHFRTLAPDMADRIIQPD